MEGEGDMDGVCMCVCVCVWGGDGGVEEGRRKWKGRTTRKERRMLGSTRRKNGKGESRIT